MHVVNVLVERKLLARNIVGMFLLVVIALHIGYHHVSLGDRCLSSEVVVVRLVSRSLSLFGSTLL
jgi:hypothetical protein